MKILNFSWSCRSLPPSRCASILAVVFRKLVLCRNENSGFKSLARSRLLPRGTHRKIADSRGTCGVSVCLCCLRGRAHPMNQKAGKQPPPGQPPGHAPEGVLAGSPPALPRCGVSTCPLVLALCRISYWSGISCPRFVMLCHFLGNEGKMQVVDRDLVIPCEWIPTTLRGARNEDGFYSSTYAPTASGSPSLLPPPGGSTGDLLFCPVRPRGESGDLPLIPGSCFRQVLCFVLVCGGHFHSCEVSAGSRLLPRMFYPPSVSVILDITFLRFTSLIFFLS